MKDSCANRVLYVPSRDAETNARIQTLLEDSEFSSVEFETALDASGTGMQLRVGEAPILLVHACQLAEVSHQLAENLGGGKAHIVVWDDQPEAACAGEEEAERRPRRQAARLHYVGPGRLAGVVKSLIGLLGENADLQRRLAASNGSGDDVARLSTELDEARRVVAEMSRDIDDHSEHLAFLSSHDSLTRLPNRQGLEVQLRAWLSALNQGAGRPFTLMIVNLDRFKVLNDILGREYADQVIVEVSARLTGALRHHDLVCRLAGDEFAVLLDGIDHARYLQRLADRILTNVARPFDIAGRQVAPRASGGAVLVAGQYETVEEVLRDASLALTRAKARGGGRTEFFDPAQHRADLDDLVLETEMARALEAGEFFFHFQPIVSMPEARIEGFEALMRWRHPKRGLISPARFIPLAEQCGMIDRLGEFAVEQACTTLLRWRESRPERELFVAINVSRRQLLDQGFADSVLARIATHGVAPASLHLEITETAMIDHIDVVSENLLRLRAAGLKICIDDFGVGYSTLSSLHRLPVDVLKVDRSFVANMALSARNEALVRAIIAMGRSLELTIVAEGIETPEEYERLAAMDCHLAQGFHFCRGVDEERAGRLLDAGDAWRDLAQTP